MLIKKGNRKLLVFDFKPHAGKTPEWVMFHNPNFINRGVTERCWETGHSEVCLHAASLWRKAKHLKIPGTCHRCKIRPISRMAIVRDGRTPGVVFLCEKCDYPGAGSIFYGQPSFFTPNILATPADIVVPDAIKLATPFLNVSRLEQGRMEIYFDDPEYFVAS